jgi:hypothetical protein
VPGSVGGFASTLEEQRVLKEGLYRNNHLLRYFVGVGKAAAAVCQSTVDRLPSSLIVFVQ